MRAAAWFLRQRSEPYAKLKKAMERDLRLHCLFENLALLLEYQPATDNYANQFRIAAAYLFNLLDL